MKIRQTSAYSTGILKTSVTVGEEDINATWIISTFKTGFLLNYIFCIILVQKLL